MTRSVEKTPWAERRSARHDAICLAIARDPLPLLQALDDVRSVARVIVETPCGAGFCDVLIESRDRMTAWFVEVKTDAERASAGVCVTESDPGPEFRELLERAGVAWVGAAAIERRRAG